MQISVSKNSDVPLRQQVAEQIVFLITNGQLQPGEQMPSVRALAQRAKLHHNTVSAAYQDLVGRGWLMRQRGKRLVVGGLANSNFTKPSSLDDLINVTIVRAREMGYSLQALTACVRERLLAQPPDHILVVEQEFGLREIIRHEVKEKLGFSATACSVEQFIDEPGRAIGAQVFTPLHLIETLKPLIPKDRPVIALKYCAADQHVLLVRRLQKPSIVAVVSISTSLLKTARGLLAPAMGRKHVFQEMLVTSTKRIDLSGVDIAFCDSITIHLVTSRRKTHYRLVAPDSLEHLATAVGVSMSR